MIYKFDEKRNVDFSADEKYPCKAILFKHKFEKDLTESTVYGFVQEPSLLTIMNSTGTYLYRLASGMYFSVTQPFMLTGGSGVLIVRLKYRGVFQIGGPIEEIGRLRYIDGCTDSLLIAPPRKGDPCLNHLHFPKNIKQTMHTHPTVRIGIVTRGQGRCVTPTGEFPLVPGVGWYLPVDGAHCFYTDDETMDVIAWHPDSDIGPDDEAHPMLNRTYVKGQSARYIDDIKTTQDTEIAG